MSAPARSYVVETMIGPVTILPGHTCATCGECRTCATHADLSGVVCAQCWEGEADYIRAHYTEEEQPRAALAAFSAAFRQPVGQTA